MAKKVYYLSTCDTCKRIMKALPLEDFEQQDIKHEAITQEQLEEMHALSGSYESLFNRRSRQYAARDLKNQNLSEDDYKQLILEEYTFLKRPVFLVDGEIFIGNSKKVVESLGVKLG
ncbi:arsenate reductase family protein [Algivirga pacifica]|uniref:Arsenate reductase n=1 Tax=Algivirga pacifica TaxID=1162670 RepID=A0ABP9DA95_9BACT